jgi:hypothetical protein
MVIEEQIVTFLLGQGKLSSKKMAFKDLMELPG